MKILNKGLLELESIWGSEGRILDTARISASDKRVEGQQLTDKDKNLLYMLLKDQHGTPFETVYFRFRISMPIFVARQWVKHRISSWNEMSKRYRGGIGDFYCPDEEARTVKSFEIMSAKQVDAYASVLKKVGEFRADLLAEMYNNIENARNNGVLPPDSKDGRDPWRARARELARNLEPVSEYTDVIWTVNFRSLMNFMNLRTSEHAQWEIRQYAIEVENLINKQLPDLIKVYKEIKDNG